MKRIIINTLIAGLIFSGCQDNWDTRFDKEPADQTVWEIINTTDDYKAFLSLLTETGYDSVLQLSGVNTVLIPPASMLESLSPLDLEEKTKITGYHISGSVLYSSDMQNITALKTMIGKQVFIQKNENDLLLNQSANFIKTDIMAQNGVIHEIDTILEIRPNIMEIIQSNSQFSEVRQYILEGTEVYFDEENSIQIGLDTIGRNVYDSVWITTNRFFEDYANLGSEDASYTLFIANNSLLNNTQEGELKTGYLSTLSTYISEGIHNLADLEQNLTAVNGATIPLSTGQVEFLSLASNGIIYEITDLTGLPIPVPFRWEFTDIADFDGVRGVSTTDYINDYITLQSLRVKDLSGGFAEFKYELKGGTYNGDYLRIKTIPRTNATLEFDLPDILPGKYMLKVNATIRVVDGIRYDAYLNNNLISADNNFNNGLYQFETREVGEIMVTEEQNNVFRMVINGASATNVYCYIDYLQFEPIK